MSQSSNVYGQALYGLARDEGLSDTVLHQLTILARSFQEEPQFLRLLSAPNITAAERCRIIDDCFRGRVHQYVLNFLKILTEKGAIKSFFVCIDAYTDQYNEDHQILPVTAVTAVPMSDVQIKQLTDKLSKITGKHAKIINRIDPNCLGGVRLDYDGKRIDGSVANRLANVRDMLKNTVL